MADRLPNLASVNCQAIRFQPGDRVIVTLRQPLQKEQIIKLKQTVEKWAGGDVEVLIVAPWLADVRCERPGDVDSDKGNVVASS